MKATNSKFILVLILLVSTVLVDCKRGDDDPIFSLRSRRNRIKGEWTLKKAEWNKGDTTTTLENDILQSGNDSIFGDSLPVTIKYTFELNGRYTINSVFTYPRNYNNNNNLAYQLTIDKTGVWNFNNGSSEDPNKSKLILIEESVQETSSITGSNVEAFEIEGATDGFLYSIKELRYDKLVLEYNKKILTEDGTLISNGLLIFVKN